MEAIAIIVVDAVLISLVGKIHILRSIIGSVVSNLGAFAVASFSQETLRDAITEDYAFIAILALLFFLTQFAIFAGLNHWQKLQLSPQKLFPLLLVAKLFTVAVVWWTLIQGIG